jgi:hypothetical protein
MILTTLRSRSDAHQQRGGSRPLTMGAAMLSAASRAAAGSFMSTCPTLTAGMLDGQVKSASATRDADSRRAGKDRR